MTTATAVSERTARTARNAAAAASANILGKIAQLAWTVVAARVLAQAELGAFFYALSLSLLLAAVGQWGFDAVVSQRASRDLDQLPALLSTSLAWQATITLPLVIVVGLAVMPGRPDDQARVVLALVLATGWLEMYGDSLRNASAAAQSQAGTATALVFQRLVTAVLAVATLAAGGGAVSLSVAFLVGSLSGAVVSTAAMRRLGVEISFAGVRREAMTTMLSQTWAMGLTGLVLVALFRLDAVVLEALKGDAAVAGYVAAYRLLETVLFVAFALRSSVFPVINSTSAPGLVQLGMERAVSAMALLYLPFGVVCLCEAREILDLLYGSTYADSSTNVLRWLAFAPLVFGIAYLTNAALQARRMFAVMLTGAVAALVLNVVLNLTLIPTYGGDGAAFATTTSYLLEAVITLVALRRAGIPVRLPRALGESAIACIGLAVVLRTLSLDLFLEVPLGMVVFAVLWVLVVRRTQPEQLAVIRRVLPGRASATEPS